MVDVHIYHCHASVMMSLTRAIYRVATILLQDSSVQCQALWQVTTLHYSKNGEKQRNCRRWDHHPCLLGSIWFCGVLFVVWTGHMRERKSHHYGCVLILARLQEVIVVIDARCCRFDVVVVVIIIVVNQRLIDIYIYHRYASILMSLTREIYRVATILLQDSSLVLLATDWRGR